MIPRSDAGDGHLKEEEKVTRVDEQTVIPPERATAPSHETKGTPEPEVCICAAVQLDGLIVIGHRHTDAMQKAVSMKEWQQEHGRIFRGGELLQGFITSRRRFVDRKEGQRLQLAAGIKSVAEGGYRGDILFSEDLY